MKTISKLLVLGITMACAAPAVADNHEDKDEQKLAIHHVHVKMGHGLAFRAGMEAYSACLAENDYDGSYSVWAAVDGDRTGFHIVGAFENWGEFDEEDEASSGCWANEDIRKGVFDHMTSWETMYAKRLDDWSGDAEGAKVVVLHNFRVKDGQEFRALVKEATGHMKDAEYEHMGTWYSVMRGGYWDPDYFVVEHFDNYSAMDEDRKGVSGVMNEATNETSTGRFWDDFGDTLAEQKGYWSNMLERQESMGYSSDD